MKHHCMETRYNGRPAKVWAGWDERMSAFFFDTEYTDVDGGPDKYPTMGAPGDTMEMLRARAEVYGITLPESMDAALREDKRNARRTAMHGACEEEVA